MYSVTEGLLHILIKQQKYELSIAILSVWKKTKTEHLKQNTNTKSLFSLFHSWYISLFRIEG